VIDGSTYDTIDSSLTTRLAKQSYKSIHSVQAHKKGDGKAIPLQAWKDPEGSKSLRRRDRKTIGT
jgi:hypothetical protein